MLSLDEAQVRLLADLTPLAEECVDLVAACGRVLAEALSAERPMPAFDNAEMDGYALIAADTAGARPDAPRRLRVLQTIPAGAAPTVHLSPGTAVRIFTGAPIPPGADAVVEQEETRAANGAVEVLRSVGAGEFVRPTGADFAAGAPVMAGGSLLGPADIGVLASLGRSCLRVIRRPRVAIVPTGNELVEADQAPGPGQVINSNGPALAAAVEAAGGLALRGPVAADDPAALAAALARAAAGADLVVTSGGVSVGDFDYVTKLLAERGELSFWRVAVKPGKPVAFGRFAGVPLIGLAGNPASTFVGFELFVRPALLKLAGHRELMRPRRRATLTAPVRPNRDRRAFFRGRLSCGADGALRVEPTVSQSSAHLSSLTNVNALIDLPAGSTAIAAGQQIDVLDLGAAPVPEHH